MKRKLRTWVKVTAGVLWITGLSAAASCRSDSLYASVHADALKEELQTHIAENKGRTGDMQKAHPAEVQAERKPGTVSAETAFVPKLLKEVASI